MKKSMLAVFCLTIMLSSCQRTPESNIVVNKNSGVFDAAMEEELPEDTSREASSGYVPVEYPERWEACYEKYNGKLKLTIDADVVVSDAEKYPVAEITPYIVPIEQANKIVEALFGSLDVYNIFLERTKEQIENRIIEIKADIQQAVNNEDEQKVNELQEVLDYWLGKLPNAPDVAEHEKYSGEYDIFQGDGYRQWSIALRKNPLDVNTPAFTIYYTFEEKAKLITGYNNGVNYLLVDELNESFAYEDEYINKVRFDEHPVFNTNEAKKAIETANRFLENIGIKDRVAEAMVATTAEENSEEIVGYNISFGREFNGIVIPPGVQLGGSAFMNTVMTKENFIAPYTFETLTILVEDGEIKQFMWNNMFEVKEIIKDNIRLLPFDGIMANAENQLAVKYAYLDRKAAYYNLFVDKIMLTYAVEPIKDRKYEYMLIPVWAFYGGTDYGEGYTRPDGTVLKGRYYEQRSLLTVNAVDGSVIFGQ